MPNLPNIFTLDLETDPFLHGRKPEVFCAGLYDGKCFVSTWGKHSIDRMVSILRELPAKSLVYMHNGGRFDIFYFLDYLEMNKPMLIIKNRIVEAYIRCNDGYIRLRDSYKILPFALAEYDKDEIDYKWFERDVRQQHKAQILKYLKKDCSALWTLVTQFLERYGNVISVGGAALKQLKSFHDIGELMNDTDDFLVRGLRHDGEIKVKREYGYYLGARVERYKVGVYEGDFKVYDVNSMYPYVMRSFRHPIGRPSYVGSKITDDTFFLTVRGRNRGAFPKRTKCGIKFDVDVGTFCITIHEWRAAMELGLFDCKEILETIDFCESTTFDKFVNHFYGMRKIAKESNDKIGALFYKFLLNNSYGRFAINPDNFKDTMITSADELDVHESHGWEPEILMTHLNKVLWTRPMDDDNKKYCNVATGASITGAARSVLMRAIPNAINPMYVDTDCVICEGLSGVPIHASELGSWDCEKVGNKLAIAGRKMYALFNDRCPECGKSKRAASCGFDMFHGSGCVKQACKGVELSPAEIVRVAMGQKIKYRRDAPTFGLDGSATFIQREVRTI